MRQADLLSEDLPVSAPTLENGASKKASRYVGEFVLDASLLDGLKDYFSQKSALPLITGQLPPKAMPGLIVDNVLSAPLCRTLLNQIPDKAWVPVGGDGIQAHYRAGDPVGSWRASCFSTALAQALWGRICPLLAPVMDFSCTPTAPTDEHALWRPLGLNPLMRFIRYQAGGLLVPHYDGPFIWDQNKRTLMSVVIYLDDASQEITCLEGQGKDDSAVELDANTGKTRFLWDALESAPASQRDFSDWTRLSLPQEIRQQVQPQVGRTIVFNHLLLHDSEPLRAACRKTVLRTDIAFEKVQEQ